MQAIQAITLKVTALEEKKQIITAFSKEFGILSFITSHGKQGVRCSTLCRIEASVIPSQKELWRCTQFSVLSSYPRLDTLEHITARRTST